MSWVMVPVPAELVADVNLFVLRLQYSSKMTPWDDDALGEHLAALDARSVSLLSLVARGVLAGRDIDVGTAADHLDGSVPEVLGIVQQLNETQTDPPRAGLIHFRIGMVADAAGGSTTQRLLFMTEEIAAAIDKVAPRPSVPPAGAAAGAE